MRPLFVCLSVLFCACSDYEIVPSNEAVDIPASCPAVELEPYTPDATSPCERAPEIGLFDPEVEWQWTTNPVSPIYDRVETPPVVFDVDEDGVPDLIFTAFQNTNYLGKGALIAVSGADQHTLFSVEEFDGHRIWGISGVAAAMIDGAPAIFVAGEGGIARVDATGNAVWLAAVPTSSGGRSAPALGDLEGDGVVDVVIGGTVVDQYGTVRWSHAEDDGMVFGGSFPVDLDLDGLQEIVTGKGVLNSDGNERWLDDDYNQGWPAIGDLDGDGLPEIVIGDPPNLVVFDINGAKVWEKTFDETGAGPPTVADFDGDGQAEIGIACRAFYRVFDGDGTLIWEQPTEEQSSGITGSSVFDFEGDGAAEVVYADEGTLWVFDGASGIVELQWELHNSGTRFEYPTIADLDADDSAEIVIGHGRAMHGTDTRGLSVIGSASGSWAPARPLWNQHAYHITNVSDDGSIPTHPAPSWIGWNNFRAAVSETPHGLGLPDLALGTPERCTEVCEDDSVEIWIPVENRGEAAAETVELTFEALAGSDLTFVRAVQVDLVPALEMTWVGPIRLTRDDFGSHGLVITAVPQIPFGTDGTMECDETNNAWRYSAFPCDF